MATIAQRRGFASQDPNNGGPPTLLLACEATLAGDPGDGLTLVSGLVADDSANVLTASTENIGLLEQKVSSPVPAFVPVTLFLPGHMYEFSFDGASAATDRGTSYQFKDGTAGLFMVVNQGTANASFTTLFFKGEIGFFHTHSFRGQSATTVTSGALNQPDVTEGVAGDTSPRALGYLAPGACALTK